ncbi:MAG: response regulator [Actinobacteria bacterium]|nr:response regulator [Actinomycetota bacterium]
MHILVAADADHVINDVTNALSGPETSFTIVREGRDVTPVVANRTPDLAILDLQIGSMGGMAVTMALRLDASAGKAPDVRILMLLDREADIHLAKRSAANGWLVKPFDALTLQSAVTAVVTESTVAG